MQHLPDARLLNPLVLSGLAAAAAVASTGVMVPAPAEAVTPSLLERLIHNQFVVAIGFVGFWALIYGFLQLWASAVAASDKGLVGFLSGQGGSRQIAPTAEDASLAASLFAERWQLLAARRMAPLSYAIWVLPLLGFIGTVIGISNAIGGLGTVFAEGDRQEALESVLGALRFAFDTTFAGLVLVIPVMAVSTWVGLTDDRARDLALSRHYGKGAPAS